jgi:hypothetical protein
MAVAAHFYLETRRGYLYRGRHDVQIRLQALRLLFLVFQVEAACRLILSAVSREKRPWVAEVPTAFSFWAFGDLTELAKKRKEVE